MMMIKALEPRLGDTVTTISRRAERLITEAIEDRNRLKLALTMLLMDVKKAMREGECRSMAGDNLSIRLSEDLLEKL